MSNIAYGAARQDFSVIRWFVTEEERDTFLEEFPECIEINTEYEGEVLIYL
jgi:hypothetical protein